MNIEKRIKVLLLFELVFFSFIAGVFVVPQDTSPELNKVLFRGHDYLNESSVLYGEREVVVTFLLK